MGEYTQGGRQPVRQQLPKKEEPKFLYDDMTIGQIMETVEAIQLLEAGWTEEAVLVGAMAAGTTMTIAAVLAAYRQGGDTPEDLVQLSFQRAPQLRRKLNKLVQLSIGQETVQIQGVNGGYGTVTFFESGEIEAELFGPQISFTASDNMEYSGFLISGPNELRHFAILQDNAGRWFFWFKSEAIREISAYLR